MQITSRSAMVQNAQRFPITLMEDKRSQRAENSAMSTSRRLGLFASEEALLNPLKGLVAGVGNVAVDELGKPRMADLRPVCDGLPVTPTALQLNPYLFAVDGFAHRAILVKYSLESKEHFTNSLRHSQRVAKSINLVVAENLAHWMNNAGIKQAALAEKAGVSQKTVSNFLNPGQRTETTSGKEPSAKLSELERIAKALAIEVWQLTREIPENEREMYEAFEKAYAKLKESAHLDRAETEAIAAGAFIGPKVPGKSKPKKAGNDEQPRD